MYILFKRRSLSNILNRIYLNCENTDPRKTSNTSYIKTFHIIISFNHEKQITITFNKSGNLETVGIYAQIFIGQSVQYNTVNS